MVKVKNKYKSTKTKPPFSALKVGNFQALPKPTAPPATANTKPIFEKYVLIIFQTHFKKAAIITITTAKGEINLKNTYQSSKNIPLI